MPRRSWPAWPPGPDPYSKRKTKFHSPYPLTGERPGLSLTCIERIHVELTPRRSPDLMTIRCDLFLVLLQAEQLVQVGARLGLDLDHPALAEWIFGDRRWIVNERFVDGDHFAVDRGI